MTSKFSVASLGVVHVGADRVRVRQRVERERRALARLEVVPHAPRGLPVVDDLVGHPRGERLVQPEVVPPRHRHQVAEPLVRELVRDHLGDALLLRQRRGRRVDEQQRPRGRSPRPRSPSRRPRSRARRSGRACRTGRGGRSSPRAAAAPPPAASCANAVSWRFSGTCQVRIGTSRATAIGLASSGPTSSATRYVDSGGVGANVSRRPPRPSFSSRMTLPFDIAIAWLGTPATRSRQTALNAGSSKHGKTRRASAASNCVTAMLPAR